MALAGAVALFNAGRYERALAAFDAAGGPQGAGLGAHCLLSLGRVEEARARLRRGLRLWPKEPSLRSALELARSAAAKQAGRGRASALAKKASALAPKRAIALLERALRLDPSFDEARAALAALRRRSTERPRAAAPGRAQGELQRAQALEASGLWKEAAAAYRLVLLSEPEEGRAWLGLGQAELALGRLGSSDRCFRRASEKTSEPLTRFAALMRLDRFAEGVAVAERILDAGPTLEQTRAFWDPWRWELWRLPESRRRRRLAAAAALKARPWDRYLRGCLTVDRAARAAELSRLPSSRRYGWMQLRAGWALLGEGGFARARAVLGRAARAEPLDWWAQGFLGEAFVGLGDWERARRALDGAVRLAPPAEKAAALAWRGELELWRGRWDAAEADLRRALAGGSLFARAWLGACALMRGRVAASLRLLDAAVAAYPRDREAYVWRGEALRRAGRLEEALADLRRPPAGLWSRVNETLALLELGRPDEAAVPYRALPADLLERLAGGKPPPARQARPLLERALRLARGYRRDDYHNAWWLPGRSPR